MSVPGFSGCLRVEDAHGDVLGDGGQNRARVQDLGAEIRQLRRFGERQLAGRPAAPARCAGSAVSMPSTSVQIWISPTSRHAPTIAAEKSEPPRPSVVVTPAGVDAMKPPRTGTSPRCEHRREVLARVRAGLGHVGRGRAVLRVGRDDGARVDEDARATRARRAPRPRCGCSPAPRSRPPHPATAARRRAARRARAPGRRASRTRAWPRPRRPVAPAPRSGRRSRRGDARAAAPPHSRRRRRRRARPPASSAIRRSVTFDSAETTTTGGGDPGGCRPICRPDDAGHAVDRVGIGRPTCRRTS